MYQSYLDTCGFDFDEGIIDTKEFNLLSHESTLSDPIDDSLLLCDIFLDTTDSDSSLSKLPRTLSVSDTTDEDELNKYPASCADNTALGAPRILKNDIRRSFSKMVFNTINCGDFDIMQEFTHTFMRPDCPFVCRVIGGPKYGLPEYLYTFSPRTHVHYKLGIFVMFPDLVGTMGDSQIITSNSWSGTKIVIPFEFRMTQTHQIPTECWIPSESQLDLLYEQPSLERMMAVLRLGDSNAASSTEDSTDTPHTPFIFDNTIATAQGRGALKKRKRRSKAVQRDTSQFIPASFVSSLYAGATPVANPKLMVVKGQFNISLDESHCVQNMSLVLVPQDNQS